MVLARKTPVVPGCYLSALCTIFQSQIPFSSSQRLAKLRGCIQGRGTGTCWTTSLSDRDVDVRLTCSLRASTCWSDHCMIRYSLHHSVAINPSQERSYIHRLHTIQTLSETLKPDWTRSLIKSLKQTLLQWSGHSWSYISSCSGRRWC